jgi:hypothetical protein
MELNGKPLKARRATIATSLSTSIAYGVHNPDVQTANRGVLERVFYVKGADGVFHTLERPEQGKFNQTLRAFKAVVRRNLPSTAPISHQEFVDLYVGRRRTIYAQAMESVLTKGVKRSDSYLNTFVKAEKVNFTAKPDPAPRIIQPRRPTYNICVGRYLKPLEHRVYKAIDQAYKQAGRCKFRTVAKGLNARRTGRLIARKWKRFTRPVGLTFDAARFDQHVSVAALKWEHQVYLDCFSGPDKAELSALLDWQLKNRGFVRCEDGSIKYTVDGCRMSGDMNTAVGNVLLMCGMMWSWLKELDIDYEIVNNGDDSLLIVNAEHVELVRNSIGPYFAKLGFDMKLEGIATTLEECKFCQTQPCNTSEGYRMVRSLEALSKDCVSLKPLPTTSSMQKWFGSIGACGMSLAGDVPVYCEFYRAFERLSGGARMGDDLTLECGMMQMAKGMDAKRSEVTEDSRYSFFLCFGVTPGEQRALEMMYRSVTEMHQLEPIKVHPTDPRYLTGRLEQFII